MAQTYKIASDFLTGVVSSSSSQKLEKKDLFYILTNYKKKDVYSLELLNNPNLFYLFIVHKIPFDLNVLRLIPQYAIYVKQIEIWEHYLKTGVIIGDLPHIFNNKQGIMVNKLKHGFDINADCVDVIQYITNKSKYAGKGFYTGGIPLPGMLSYEVHDLPLQIQTKEVEFIDFLIFYNEPHVWIHNSSELEELKLGEAKTIIFEAAPYITTKREFQLAYVLCRKKLIILKNNYRKEEIKSWVFVLPSAASDVLAPGPVVRKTVWTTISQ